MASLGAWLAREEAREEGKSRSGAWRKEKHTGGRQVVESRI
jgi:hypothetical protein